MIVYTFHFMVVSAFQLELNKWYGAGLAAQLMEVMCIWMMENQTWRLDIFVVVASLRVWDMTWKLLEELVMFHGIILITCIRQGWWKTLIQGFIEVPFVGKRYKILFSEKDQIGWYPEYQKRYVTRAKIIKKKKGKTARILAMVTSVISLVF